MTSYSWEQSGHLGRYDGLTDYLLPIIKLMRGGMSHIDAFKQRADKLIRTKETARHHCTRKLGLNVDGFVKLVRSGRIVQWLKEKFPDRHAEIDRELGSWTGDVNQPRIHSSG